MLDNDSITLSEEDIIPLNILGDLVGSLKGGPANLSSNDKYLEGLGNDIDLTNL